MSKPGDIWRSDDGSIELRCGRWQDVLGDVTCDALVTDPPYSERILLGYRSGSDVDRSGRRGVFNIPYAEWRQEDAREFCTWSAAHVRHFGVVFNDHVGADWLRRGFAESGMYVFAPVPWVRTNPPPRFAGDGPTNATEWITVAASAAMGDGCPVGGPADGSDWITVVRPRGLPKGDRAGSRPGYYICPAENVKTQILVGQKPIGLIRRIIREYTLPGDLIAEPFCGSGTILLAAAMEGRRAIGSELDPRTFDLATQRLRGLGPHDEKGQRNLFGSAA